jgi:hypothetical protein
MVYTVPFFLGRVPGMHINLVLATDCEWTYISGKNCSVEDGCSHGVYDHHMTTSEKVNWTLIYSVVSIRYNSRGRYCLSNLVLS